MMICLPVAQQQSIRDEQIMWKPFNASEETKIEPFFRPTHYHLLLCLAQLDTKFIMPIYPLQFSKSQLCFKESQNEANEEANDKIKISGLRRDEEYHGNATTWKLRCEIKDLR